MVHVEKELMVQTLDILERRNDLLQVLILGSSVDWVVNLHGRPYEPSQTEEI